VPCCAGRIQARRIENGGRTREPSIVEIGIFVFFAILVVALGIYSYYQTQARQKALGELAARNGWQFSTARDSGMESRFSEFPCFQQGSNRYAYNVLEGRGDQRSICAFDYHYETYTTDSKGNSQTNHHHFSAMIVLVPWPLKPLLIRPEGLFDKIGEFLGFDDIDFESHEFSRKFFVKSPDRRWAFDVIHQATMEFLLAAPRFTIEMSGPAVVASRSSLFEPADFEDAYRVVSGILDRLPEYLLKEWKGAMR
jgi:hypothetical protein